MEDQEKDSYQLSSRGQSHLDDRVIRKPETIAVEETLPEAEWPDTPSSWAKSGIIINPSKTSIKPSSIPGKPAQKIGRQFASEADVPVEWEIGDLILDTYEVVDNSLKGGMGVVYKVHHQGWNLNLAVKSPLLKYTQEPSIENFIREANVWIDLGIHPHIVTCFYVRTLGNIPRLFAEFVDGGSLKNWIIDGRLYAGGLRPALERILDIAIQMAWGLSYAHRQKLVHQDVKPDNVMLTLDGLAKINDFGIARARPVEQVEVPDGRGGTVLVSRGGMDKYYCSPEQANGKPLNRKTDVWSWGVLLLEMFVGSLEWPSGTVARHSLSAYLKNSPQKPAIPAMPTELTDLLKGCFAESPTDRPTMDDVAEILLKIYRQEIGNEYRHKMPQPVELQADSLNNKAVSFIDLERYEEALKLLDNAFSLDQTHPEAIYNRNLLLERSGQMEDFKSKRLMGFLDGHPHEWRYNYLQGLLELGNGFQVQGLDFFEKAFATSAKNPQAEQALKLANDENLWWAGCLKVFEGHTGKVTSVAISSDGRWGLSGSEDKTLRLWDLEKRQYVRVFEGHYRQVTSVAISPDNQLGLSGSRDKTMRLWDLETGQCLRTFKGSWLSGEVTCVAISPTHRLGFSGSSDATVKLWHLDTGQNLGTLKGHNKRINCLAISTDGRFLLSGSDDKTLRVWDLVQRQSYILKGHADGVTTVAISSDSHWVLSGGKDQILKLWGGLNDGYCVEVISSKRLVNDVAISTDERHLVLSGGQGKTMRLGHLVGGGILRTLEGHEDDITSVAISSDGCLGLSGSADRTVRLWELGTRKYPLPYVLAHPPSYRDASQFESLLEQVQHAFSVNQSKEASMSLEKARQLPGYQQTPEVINLNAKLGQKGIRRELRLGHSAGILEGHTRAVHAIAITGDGRYALSGSNDQTLRWWDLQSRQCLNTLSGHSAFITCVALFPTGFKAVSGDESGRLFLWDLGQSQPLQILKDHAGEVTSVAISPNGNLFLSGGGASKIKDVSKAFGELILWDISIGNLKRLEGHTDRVTSVAISADGRWGLSGSCDKTIRLWDLNTGCCLRTFIGHAGWVKQVAFLPNNQHIISTNSGDPGNLDDEPSVRLWDIQTGRCLRTYGRYFLPCMATSLDGKWVFARGGAEFLWLCNLDTGITPSIEFNGERIASIAVTPDCRYVICGGSVDGKLQIWEMDWLYEFPDPADWNESARPYLENFLTLEVGAEGIENIKIALASTPIPYLMDKDFEPEKRANNETEPTFEHKFKQFLIQLGYSGYGWLRPEGVWRELEKRVTDWQGPQPMPELPWATKFVVQLKQQVAQIKDWATKPRTPTLKGIFIAYLIGIIGVVLGLVVCSWLNTLVG